MWSLQGTTKDPRGVKTSQQSGHVPGFAILCKPDLFGANKSHHLPGKGAR